MLIKQPQYQSSKLCFVLMKNNNNTKKITPFKINSSTKTEKVFL